MGILGGFAGGEEGLDFRLREGAGAAAWLFRFADLAHWAVIEPLPVLDRGGERVRERRKITNDRAWRGLLAVTKLVHKQFVAAFPDLGRGEIGERQVPEFALPPLELIRLCLGVGWFGWQDLRDVFVDEFANRMLLGGSSFEIAALTDGRFGGLRPPSGIGESREGCSLRWVPV